MVSHIYDSELTFSKDNITPVFLSNRVFLIFSDRWHHEPAAQ